ncbi:(2,3-dihydroxybenzoyl)adenylate synthase [Rhodococcus sp. NPDC058514]|uniref:(2,3-dihydroxybenzoyl)adenylate synthase n=1 Tax=unclassified Rhodococcus (in: high G+C Gram-positive bacteria) TaxID=192944 RepID=UPI003659736E
MERRTGAISSAASGSVPYPEQFARHYRSVGHWRDETLQEFAVRRLDRLGDRTALHGLDHRGRELRLTYSDLSARAARIAAGLAEHGIGAGDRVVVQLPNSIEFVEAVLALFRIGAIPVFALPAHRLEVAGFIERSGAVAYLVPAVHAGTDYRELAREIGRAVSRRPLVVVAGEPAEFVSFDSLREFSPMDDLVCVDSEDIALLQLSGGTTGAPKLIPRTHADYLYAIRASADICDLGSGTVMLVALPAAHNFSMSSPGWLGALHAGAQVVLAPDPLPDTAFELIGRFGVTITGLVPSLALAWLAAHEGVDDDLSSLEVVQVGGAKLGVHAARRIRDELGCTLQQVFGMAEGLVNYTRLGDPADTILATQGRPASPDDEIRIVDHADNPVPRGEAGHLQTRGPCTIRGYYRAPEHNVGAFTADGFYRTGDIVRLTEDGNLVVEGRSKDQINRCGEKFAADEIEQTLMTHPDVREAAVVAVPDDLLGERSCAFLVIAQNAGKMPAPCMIRQFVRGCGLATYKIPDQIEFVAGLPKTAVGKIDKRALRDRAEEGR